MAKFKIEFDSKGCIGCGACEQQCPQNWKLEETSEAFIAKPNKTEFDESELEDNKIAAESCPVQIIHIVDEKGVKIV
ncbi:MAG: ferredoxin [archaeon]